MYTEFNCFAIADYDLLKALETITKIYSIYVRMNAIESAAQSKYTYNLNSENISHFYGCVLCARACVFA